jgi:hypothetical protein
MSSLDDKLAELAELSKQFQASKLIRDIWPEAFDAGKCKFSGYQQHTRRAGIPQWQLAFLEAWFERSDDGVRHYLTKDELRRFKPDAAIHPQYRY